MRFCTLLCAGLLLAGCAEEPDRLVDTTTGDDRFELTLEATDDWVRPGFALPIKVRVESLTGPLDEPWQAELELVANNGNVSPSSLNVVFGGVAEGETADAADSVFEAWITFAAGSRITTAVQGEVHALFLDVHSALKIRITPEFVE